MAQTPRPPSVFGDSAQLAPGDVLARKYRLLAHLGEGGMAEVWVALNIALDTKVAIKILREQLSNDARLVSRVRQEAKATAAIAHKNIVQVFDYGVTGWGAPFIVMELLHGETLAERLKTRGKLSPTEAARIMLRAMKGVTVAHAKGIVHRDLKPENIFLALEDNGTERPKVLDFGVASVMREGADDRSRSGGLVGTPAYLPPEVIALDERGDPRGDVWALGVILYETMTGELPFQGQTTHAILEAIVSAEPPPMRPRAKVDADLEAIVRKALAKSPADRFSGVRELFDALNVWLGSQAPDGALSIPKLSAPLALPADPHSDDEGPTVVGPSLDSSAQLPAARDAFSSRPGLGTTGRGASARASSPPPPTATSRPSMRSARAAERSGVATYVLAGLGALALASGVALLAASRPSSVPPAAPSTERPGPPLVAPAAAAEAPTLDIVALPDGATVRVDGVEVTLPTRVVKGSTVHVEVDCAAFLPWTQDVSADGSVRLTFTGVPKPAASVLKTWPRPSKPPGDYKEVPY